MNLHDILLKEGSRVSFRCPLSEDRLVFPALVEFLSPPVGEGEIFNEAGALMLRGTLNADMRLTCDRCMSEYEKSVSFPMEIPLATELEDEGNPDYFLLDGEDLDMEDLLETVFILNTDTRSLCKEDCKGLCDKCGANLNKGPCNCKAETDPRLAVLEQLLENKDF